MSSTSEARSRTLSRSLLAALGAAAATVSLAGQASASAGGSGVHRGPTYLIAPASTSSSFAGYAVTPNAGVASASATFKVPAITCSDNNPYGQYLGVLVYPTVFSFVHEFCNGSGGAAYEYLLDAGTGTFTHLGISAGDMVVTSVFESTSTMEVEVHDITALGGFSDSSTVSLSLTTAYLGSLSDGGGGVPPFVKVPFTKCQVNGDYLVFESWTQYNEVSGSKTLIAASALASSGDGFKLTFKHET